MRPNQENTSDYEQKFKALTVDNNDFYKCDIFPKDIKNKKNMTIEQESDKFINTTNTTAEMMISGGTLHFKYDQKECTDNARLVDLPYAENLRTRCRFIIAILNNYNGSTKYVVSLKGVGTHVKLSVDTPLQSHLK